MKLLTFTTLYPNLNRPSHGIFVETRLAQLVASGQVTARVMAPVPYVPDLTFLPDHYRRFCGVPEREERGGIVVDHPRYFLLPKLSMSAAPVLLYLAARRRLSALLRDGYEFDIIDAHYFYPDGIAAVLLGRYFGKPVIVTARGSDINVLAQYRLPRRMIRWAAAEADGIIAVSRALERSLLALGAPAGKIRVLRNGVDLRAFRPGDRAAARARFGVDGPLLLSVGNLVPLKGHDIAIQALMSLLGMHLAIVGDGAGGGAPARARRALRRCRARALPRPIAPDGAARTLCRRRCAAPAVEQRGLAQRAAGGDGVWYPRYRHPRRRDPGNNRDARGRRARRSAHALCRRRGG